MRSSILLYNCRSIYEYITMKILFNESQTSAHLAETKNRVRAIMLTLPLYWEKQEARPGQITSQVTACQGQITLIGFWVLHGFLVWNYCEIPFSHALPQVCGISTTIRLSEWGAADMRGDGKSCSSEEGISHFFLALHGDNPEETKARLTSKSTSRSTPEWLLWEHLYCFPFPPWKSSTITNLQTIFC